MWFRVVTNKDGGIASCDAVEGQEHDGKGIFYVDAQTPAAACLAAKQMWLDRYDRVSRQTSESGRRRRAETDKRGLCVCGKPKEQGRALCRSCLDRKALSQRNRKAGLSTRRIARTETERLEIIKNRLDRDKKYAQELSLRISSQERKALYVLREVLADFRRLSPPNAAPKFEGHLVAQIAELEAKRQQKPEPKAQAAE